MPKIKANGIEIEYSIDGEGVPLVLIAGLGYSRWCWHRVVPELSKRFKVISFDNRGIGGTDRTPGPYNAELLADDTAALLDALNIPKAHIVGISMGGFIAQALVTRRPDLFLSLTLMNTGFGGARQVPTPPEVLDLLKDTTLDTRRRALISCAPGFENREKEFVDSWMEIRAANPPHPEGYLSQLAVGLQLLEQGKSFETALASVRVPTLIIAGELDRLVPAANAWLLKEAIKDSQAIVLSEVAHFLPFECPEEIVRRLTTFIESVRAPQGQAVGCTI